MKYIKYYIDYDGINILKCPKCGSYNIKTAEDDGIVDVYYRCEDCNYKSRINHTKEVIMEAVSFISKFIVTINYDIVNKIFEIYKIKNEKNELPIEIVEEMIKLKNNKKL